MDQTLTRCGSYDRYSGTFMQSWFLVQTKGCKRLRHIACDFCSSRCFVSFQFVRSDELTLPQLAAVCQELVKRWDDLTGYFGSESSGSLVEMRSVSSLNVVIFIDRLSRHQVAILSCF